SVTNWSQRLRRASNRRQSWSSAQYSARRCTVSSCTPWDWSSTGSRSGGRHAATRCLRSRSASSPTWYSNGRMAVSGVVGAMVAVLRRWRVDSHHDERGPPGSSQGPPRASAWFPRTRRASPSGRRAEVAGGGEALAQLLAVREIELGEHLPEVPL